MCLLVPRTVPGMGRHSDNVCGMNEHETQKNYHISLRIVSNNQHYQHISFLFLWSLAWEEGNPVCLQLKGRLVQKHRHQQKTSPLEFLRSPVHRWY